MASPAAQALKNSYSEASEKIAAERIDAQGALLDKALKIAQEENARAKVSGNITKSAIALAAVQAYEGAVERMKNDKVFELPEKARREVQAMLDDTRRQNTGIMAIETTALNTLRLETAQKLRALLAEQGTPVNSDSEAEALLPKLLGTQAPQAEGKVAGEGAAKGEGGEKGGGEGEEAIKPPGEVASTGFATDWVSLITIEISVGALEVVSIPLEGVAAARSYTQPGMEPGNEIAVSLKPERILPKNQSNAIYRGMSVQGFPAPDVVGWPSARNGWRLELRCRPRGEKPNALRIEVSGVSEPMKMASGAQPAGASAAVGAGEQTAPAVAMLPVKVESRPEGAFIWMDGILVTRGRTPMATPCEIRLPETGATIVLRKAAHLDAQIGRVNPSEKKLIQAVLTPDPDFVDRALNIHAMGGGGHSGVTLKAGQRVRITPQGAWACGSRGEMVNSEGYPIDKFPHYYVNPAVTPRQIGTAQYGALLVRIGRDGPWQPVGKGLTIDVKESGSLQFDVNEGPDKAMRRDNKGALKVQVTTLPKI